MDLEQEAFNPKAIAKRMRRAQLDAYNAIERNSSNAIKDILALLKDLQKEIQSQLKNIPPDKFSTFQLKRLHQIIDSEIANFTARASSIIGEGVLDSAKLGQDYWNTILRAMGQDRGIPFSPVLSQELLSTVSSMSVELIKGLSNEIASQTKAALQRAVLGGVTPYDAAQQIATIVGARGDIGAGAAADRIVRTETARAFNAADDLISRDVAASRPKDLPPIMKVWIATIDNRTRPDHLAAHKQVQSLEDPFQVGGESLDFPEDPAGSAGNTINCRCIAIRVPEDILDETLAIYPG